MLDCFVASLLAMTEDGSGDWTLKPVRVTARGWTWRSIGCRTHPANPSVAVDGIDFSVERRSATNLRFRFEARGRIGEIILPARAAPVRTNALWERTCFEVFLRPAEFADYRELNFSPSSQWAAYAFSTHRAGMMQAALPAPPIIEIVAGPEQLTVDVSISLDLPDEPYLMAAAAVIEESGAANPCGRSRMTGAFPISIIRLASRWNSRQRGQIRHPGLDPGSTFFREAKKMDAGSSPA